MADVSTITSQVTTGAAIIAVSPQATIGYQPQPSPNSTTKQNFPTLIFHYEGEQTATIKSDITDHFIEDNTAIQDQIALKPIIITTQGFIGELNDVAPSFLAPLQTLANKLTLLGGYAPSLSATALLAYNEAAFAYSTVINAADTAISTLSALGNVLTGSGGQAVINGLNFTQASNQNQQQKYFQQFYLYWATTTLFTVQTPWAVFQNMAIDSLRAVQDAETNEISTFEISFKQLRFASTQIGGVNQSSLGRLIAQSSSTVNLGTSSPPVLASAPAALTAVGIA